MNEKTILKRLDQYQCLKNFLGVGWFKEMINSSRPRKHPLYWLLTRDIPHTSAVLHNLTDNLEIVLQVIEKYPKREEKEKRLCGKLKNTTEFYDVLPEIEWAAYLKKRGFPVSIEPTFPKKGPDLKAEINGEDIYFEIKSQNLSEDDRKEENYFIEIMDRIKEIQSRFFVSTSLRDNFSDEDLIPVIRLIKKKINGFERKNIYQPVSVYYFSPSDIREWSGYDELNPPHDVYSNPMKYPLFWERHKAKVIITFYPLDDYFGATIVGIGGGAEDVDDTKRVRKSISRKLEQLPTNAPAVVVINVTFSYADDISVEDAIYGSSIYTIRLNTQTGETADGYWNRKRNGIFQSIRRISAVVMYKQKVSNEGFIEFERKIYRNPMAKNPLDKDQISKIGEIMD